MFINIDSPESLKQFEVHSHLDSKQGVELNNLGACVGVNSDRLVQRHRTTGSLPDLTCFSIVNGSVGSTGVIYSEDDPIYSELQFKKELIKARCDNEVNDKRGHYSSYRVVSLIRPGDHIYGHWLVDILPKVWLAQKEPKLNRDFRYLVRESIPDFALKLLEHMGVTKKDLIFVPKNTRTQFGEIIFIPNLRYDQYVHPIFCEYTSKLNALFNYDERDCSAVTPSKVFLSRKSWRLTSNKKHRGLVNSEEVEKWFRSQGFEIMYPEALTLSEQVKIYQNVDILAGEDGSALHNNIFTKQGACVVSLRGEKNHSLIQGSLCSALEQTIHYVIGRADEETPSRNSSFSIDMNDLELIRKYF